MTLEEKASLCSGADFWHTKAVERLGIAQVMVSDGPHGLRKQDSEADHLGINDSIKAVCFPAACATAASFDPDMIEEMGEALGEACQAEKLAVILGPGTNIKRSPLCGRNFEYFSEDPYLAGKDAAALIRGVQKKNVGTSLKHFAGNNQEHRRMSSDSVIDERALREIYLPAFEEAVKQGKPWTVMCSYNSLNGTFASMNRWLLTDLLRDEWGFDGYVMTDWGAVTDRVKGLEAGLELEMPSSGGVNDEKIVQAVKSGELDEGVLDRAVERMLRVHARYWDNAKPDTAWDKDAQHELARRIASQCMVLLKNEGEALPLKRGETVAVLGAFAEKPRFQGGGSSHINAYRTSSLLDAVKGMPGVRYAPGYPVGRDEIDEGLLEEAAALAAKADKAVVVAGLPDEFESEGYDRKHLGMPACHDELIRRVSEANPNTVVVLLNGSPVTMPWLGSVKGVLEAYLGGENAGYALYDVLWGKVSPSGRLPETFPLRIEDTPCYITYGGERNKAVYSEGIFVGYRWYDKRKLDVLFPFGHGLSYAKFAWTDMKVSKAQIDDTETLEVSVTVENVGNVPGSDVVQLYVGDVESTYFRPVRELKGFKKVYLEPGEKKAVTLELDKRSFAYWDPEIHAWHVESGDFRIELARSSRDIAWSETVAVRSTEPIRRVFDENSILMDIMEDPRGKAVVDGMMKAMGSSMGMTEDAAQDTASSAVSPEMMMAMMQYMPLRALRAFAGIREEQFRGILAALNA